jgi:hypothetical protein
MAKKINVDEIDERFIVAAVRKERVMPEIVPPPLAPLPAAAPAQAEQQPKEETLPPSPSELQKEEPRGKRAGQTGYESLFIRETDLPPARFGKSVYIRKEYHDRISQITSVIGGNEVSLFGYIDNVLAHHFDNFQDDIIRSFKKKTIFK